LRSCSWITTSCATKQLSQTLALASRPCSSKGTPLLQSSPTKAPPQLRQWCRGVVRLKLILLAAQVVAAVSGQGSGMIDSVPPPTAKPSPPLPLPPLLLPRFFLRREDEDEDEDEDEEAAVSCFF
jgi:hypothetical protein